MVGNMHIGDSGKYIMDSHQRELDLDKKIEDVKMKREKAKQTGLQVDFQEAVLADLDVIKVKLDI